MRLGPVDFPEKILAALREGKLVVFAGAGVSVNDPANLPNFEGLANEVACRTGHARQEGEGPVDYFTRIDAGHKVVHQEVAGALREKAPKPNSLHENIVRLFVRRDFPKIVSTNFDLLFEDAQPTPRSPIYTAPALPPGDRFQGIVHLHGDINSPEEIVITLPDISRAYLMEGWALNFLKQMFSAHTVLFVGYSHDDVMMQHLARGMPSTGEENQTRYALVRDTEAASGTWETWNITPVTFPEEPSDKYANLPLAIEKLAEFIQRGPADWEHRIQEIAGRPFAPTDPEEQDLIREVFRDPEEKLSAFTQIARTDDWLKWVENNFDTKKLFQSGDLGLGDRKLAEWMATKFAVHHPYELMAVIGRHDSSVNPALWEQIACALANQQPANASLDSTRKWITLLLDKTPRPATEGTCAGLEYIAEVCLKENLIDFLIVCFGEMCRVQLKVRDKSLEPETVCPHWLLQKTWFGMKTNLGHVAGPVLEQAVRQLEERQMAVVQWDYGSEANSPDSGCEADIRHSSDAPATHGFDAVTDAARDCLVHLVENDPGGALQWCNTHVRSRDELLKRLSIDTMGIIPSDYQSDDDKINWIIDHELTFHPNVQEEAIVLAASVFSGAAQATQERLLAVLREPAAQTEDPT